MGTYLYTMRKKKVTLWIPANCGWKADKANLYSYAYKPSYAFNLSNSYRLMAARYERGASVAFADYSGGFVIDGNVEDGLDDCPVYTKVSKGSYLDCYAFPGELVGFVDVRDGRNYLVPHTKWVTATRCSDDTTFKIRNIVKDGQVGYEEQEVA